MPDETEMGDEGVAESSAIPASLVDELPAPGDTIKVRVVSVDESAKTITVTKAETESEEPEEPEEMKGSDAAAAEFDNPQTT